MTRRDQQLLERQLSHLHIPERHDGALMLTMTALFVAGLFLGDWHAATAEAKLQQTRDMTVAALSGTVPTSTLVR
ncbi:MAG TPA: hypothetical protein VL976_06945 [Xanthobacteraceae bacterium]|jgi:hypothetical protein|nr:hypothetical protein [Xanthobacteraceae bacterium]